MPPVRAGANPSNPTGKTAGEPPPEIPRDQWGRPLIKKPTGGGTTAYTRASTLGGTLEDQYNLGIWRGQQVAFGMSRSRPLQLAAAAIETADGELDKKALREVAEKAMEVAESSAKATIGTALHALSEQLDRGKKIPDIGPDQATLDAYASVISHFTIHGIEEFVVCDDHRVAGTFDRLVSPVGEMRAPDGTLFTANSRLVLDLKTSSTADYFGIKFAVQLAEYAHAVPYTHSGGRGMWPDGIAPDTSWGLILHVPSGSATANLHWVDLDSGRELSDLALIVRRHRTRKDLVRPARLPEVGRREPDQVTKLGITALLRHAPDEAALKALWAAHKSEWTEDMTRMAKARQRELRAQHGTVEEGS